jgi:hypothetical protein
VDQSLRKYLASTKENIRYLYVFFLIYPFGAFLYVLKDFGAKRYRFILISFFVLYGFSFIPIENSDGGRYVELFKEYQNYSFADYWLEIRNTYSSLSRNQDIYSSSLLYITSRVSTSPQVFFAFAAMIYFSIFLKFLEVLWSMGNSNKMGIFLLFLIGCVFILNLSAGINGIRFPLAFMFFSLCALLLILTDNSKYLVFSLLAGLIHFALWLACLILFIFYIFRSGRYLYFLYGLLIVSLFANTYFSDLFFQNISFFNEGLQTKFLDYTREGYITLREEHKNGWNWYVLYNMYATYYFVIAVIILTRINIFRLRTNIISQRIYVFLILLLALSFLSGNVLDSISNRYVIIFKLFGLIYIFYLCLLNNHNRLMRTAAYAYIPIVTLTVLVALRADYFTVSPYLFLGNILMIIFFKSEVPISDLL